MKNISQEVKTKWGKKYKLVAYELSDGTKTKSKPRIKSECKAIHTTGGRILIDNVDDYKSLRKSK